MVKKWNNNETMNNGNKSLYARQTAANRKKTDRYRTARDQSDAPLRVDRIVTSDRETFAYIMVKYVKYVHMRGNKTFRHLCEPSSLAVLAELDVGPIFS